MKTLGIYLHIPFCLQKCNYCDFCSFGGFSEHTADAYVTELCRRMEQMKPSCMSYLVDTVYFGGGTPTLLSASQMERLMGAVTRLAPLASDCEITMECNPATADESKLRAFRTLGVNRLSIGLQSAQERELRTLGRLHTFSDFCRTVEQARQAGIDNISADLMLGIPHQTVDSYRDTLSRLLSLDVSHVSAYGLKIEKGTPFYAQRNTLPLPDEDAECDMYEMTGEVLASAGFAQYEISNYAKAGKESRHNLKYWTCAEYLGFGLAAHSDFGGARFANSRDMAAFLRGENIECERTVPGGEERRNEYVMLRMRLAQGMDFAAYADRFGENFEARYGALLAPYEAAGLLHRTAKGIAFTPKGFLLSNSVLSEMLDFD